MYFHTDDPKVLLALLNATHRAATGNSSIRIDVDSNGRLKYKVGGGCWSPSIDSTADLSRDEPVALKIENVWAHEDKSLCGLSELPSICLGHEIDECKEHERPIRLVQRVNGQIG